MYSNLKRLFKSSSIYAAGNIINRALFLLSMPILTRFLAPDEYGTLSVVNVVTGIMMTFYGLGSTSFAMRFYYDFEFEEERKLLLGSIFTYILIFTFALSLVLSVFGDVFFEAFFKDIAFSPYMLLGIWIAFLSMFELFPDALFRIRDEAMSFIVVHFLKGICTIGFSIFAVVVLNRGAEGPLGASVVTGIMFGIYYIYYLRDKIKINFSNVFIKKCLAFGLPIVFLLLGRVLLDASDRLILQRFVDLSIVGMYSVGTTIGSVLVLIASSINSAWIPFFYATAKEDDHGAKEIFSYAATYVGMLILFLAMCIAVFRQEIVYILAPRAYYPVIEIIPYLIVGAIFNSLFFVPVRGIYQKKKTHSLLIIISAALILNILLNCLLIPKFNMLGAALATICASALMLVLCLIISQRLYYIPYQYKRFTKILFVSILCYIGCEVVQGRQLVLSIICKSFMILLFPVMLYLSRFFEPRELDKIRQISLKVIKARKVVL